MTPGCGPTSTRKVCAPALFIPLRALVHSRLSAPSHYLCMSVLEISSTRYTCVHARKHQHKYYTIHTHTHTHTSMRVFLEFLRRRHVLASAAKCMRMSRMHARYLHTTGARAMSPCCRQAFNILLFVSAGAHAVCCRPPRDGFAVLSVRQYIYTIYVHTIYREIEIEIEIDRFRYLNHCRPASAYVTVASSACP